MIDAKYLTEALAGLSGVKRHAFKRALCEFRDRHVAEGEHDVALVYNALAATIADIEDHERAVLRELEASFWEPPC